MLDGVVGLSEAPDAGGSGGKLKGLSDRVDRMKTQLNELDSLLAKVAPLYDGKEAPGGPRLREILEKAGLDGRVPPEAWRALDEGREGAQAADPLPARIVRDAALASQLAQASRTLDAWEPEVGKWGPLAALNQAFQAFAGGDLDGAILSLREARQKERIPSRGKGAAIAHAAMSYFLHKKILSLSATRGEATLAKSLEQDARREAGLAIRADATFRLPEGLFRDSSFRETFRSFTQAEIR
jgi:hypothetical protein